MSIPEEAKRRGDTSNLLDEVGPHLRELRHGLRRASDVVELNPVDDKSKKSPGMSHSMIGVTSKFSTVQLVSTSTSDV
jgi:hypothetical protein